MSHSTPFQQYTTHSYFFKTNTSQQSNTSLYKMGLFGSARKKSNAGPSQSSICQSSEQTKVATNAAIHAQDGILSPTKKLLRRVSGSFHDRSATHQPSSSTRKSLNLLGRFYGNNNEVVESANVIVTMEHLPDLILDLETAVETSAQRPTRSLHMLFALSEHGHNNDNRIEMVRHGDGDIYCADDSDNDDGSPRSCGKLVPALLTFLKRCHVNSQEYRLTLLVLNNISIPFENKRVSHIISFDFHFQFMRLRGLSGSTKQKWIGSVSCLACCESHLYLYNPILHPVF